MNRLNLIQKIVENINAIPIDGVKDEIFYFTLSSLANDYYLINNRINDKIFEMIQAKLKNMLVDS